jgi:hypothetical protein
VVQRALKIVEGDNKKKLISVITKNFDKISDKKLIGKWKVIINNCSGNYLTLFNNKNKLNNQRHSAYFFNPENFNYNILNSPQLDNGSPIYNNNPVLSRSYQNSPNAPLSPYLSLINTYSPALGYTNNVPSINYNSVQGCNGVNNKYS